MICIVEPDSLLYRKFYDVIRRLLGACPLTRIGLTAYRITKNWGWFRQGGPL